MITRRPRGRGQQQVAVTGRKLLVVVALGALAGSAGFWWEVERTLTASAGVAAAYTLILTLAPPMLMAFLLPWSPAGQLLLRLRARTWGTLVVILCVVALGWYSIERQAAWWALQPVVAASGLTTLQVLIGLLGFVIIPALVWAPTSDTSLLATITQAQLVARYAAQTQADLALLRATLLRAQALTSRGWTACTPAEQAELEQILRGLVGGIASTLEQLTTSVTSMTGVHIPPPVLDDLPAVQAALEHCAAALATDPSARLERDTPAARSSRQQPGRQRLEPAVDDTPLRTRRTAADTEPATAAPPRSRRTSSGR